MSKGIFFVILAPTGAGKTTVAREILKQLPQLARIITVTTRPPRPNERDGIDYHFISEKEFNARKKDGAFIETTSFGGAHYGSPKSALEELTSGKSFIAVMDRPGGIAVKKLLGNDAVLLWIAPPSFEELTNRLIKRKSESPEKLAERIEIGKSEIAEEQHTPICEATFINDDLTACVENMVAFIKERIT